MSVSPLDLAYTRHPSLQKPLADLIDFLDAKQWGDFQLSVKNGRVVHYFKTISVPVSDINNSRSDEREAINLKEQNHG